MRVLLDTNIVIAREDNKIIEENVQILMKILNQLNINIVLHPKSIEDINKDENETRKQIILSKLKAYRFLDKFPEPSKDFEFLKIVGEPKRINDIIDNYFLIAVYRNTVNFLVTEDVGIHKKAKNLDISDRILLIFDAISIFEKEIPKEKIKMPLALKVTTMSQLNINDPIFDNLRKSYPDFNEWFIKKARDGRNCWVYYRNGNKIAAILIYKFENEEIPSRPKLPKKDRIKIATMIVSYWGQKIGELFIKLVINLAIKNNTKEIYITHFTKENDHLVTLIEDFGFNKVAIIEREWSEIPEDVFLKKIIISKKDVQFVEPIQISKKYYPNIYDGNDVRKFIIPIQPMYHDRLFNDFPKREQLTINEVSNEFIIEGNTIRKAYLTHSLIKKIKPGDILLFYRSVDRKELISLGVVEKIQYGITNKVDILNFVGKRTVYSHSEIEKIVQKPTTVILFNHHFYFKTFIPYEKLLDLNILQGPVQSITEIDHQKYLYVKKKGRINECFTFN